MFLKLIINFNNMPMFSHSRNKGFIIIIIIIIIIRHLCEKVIACYKLYSSFFACNKIYQNIPENYKIGHSVITNSKNYNTIAIGC